MKKVATFEKVSMKQFKEGYEKVLKCSISDDKIKQFYENIKLPVRSTKGSAGHDISIPFAISIMPGDSLMFPTGLRCKMNEDYVMLVFPRSSLGIKKGLFIKNTIPVVDSDYYFAENEGHIFICVENTSKNVIHFEAGDNIVQALFLPYGVADDEEVTNKRVGGIGSTTK